MAPNDNDPVFTYRSPIFKLQVYHNRIDIEQGLLRKKESILLRNVTSVGIGRVARTLQITTADGKERDFNVGLQAGAARDAIINNL